MANEMASCVDRCYVPRFDTLHWVPLRCRRILPLSVLKQYRCIVVGATQAELTVAFAVQPGRSVIAVLSRLTRRDIFPILTEPDRIQLLIQRIELYNQHRHALNWPHYIHWFLVHSIIVEYTQPQRQMYVLPDKQ